MLKILKSKAHVCLINSYKTIKRRHRLVKAVNSPKEDGSMDLCWGDSRLGGFSYDMSCSPAGNSSGNARVGAWGLQEGRARVRTSVIKQ